MMLKNSLRLLGLAVAVLTVQSSLAQSRTSQLLNAGWKFQSGDVKGAEAASFEGSNWQTLSLPHNWGWEQAQRGEKYQRGGDVGTVESRVEHGHHHRQQGDAEQGKDGRPRELHDASVTRPRSTVECGVDVRGQFAAHAIDLRQFVDARRGDAADAAEMLQ